MCHVYWNTSLSYCLSSGRKISGVLTRDSEVEPVSSLVVIEEESWVQSPWHRWLLLNLSNNSCYRNPWNWRGFSQGILMQWYSLRSNHRNDLTPMSHRHGPCSLLSLLHLQTMTLLIQSVWVWAVFLRNSADAKRLLVVSAAICTGCTVTLKSTHDTQALG